MRLREFLLVQLASDSVYLPALFVFEYNIILMEREQNHVFVDQQQINDARLTITPQYVDTLCELMAAIEEEVLVRARSVSLGRKVKETVEKR